MSHAVKPKSQVLKQPIRQKGNVKRSQWQLKVKTGKLPKMRENEGDQVTIRFSFEYDWLRKRREISGPITRRSRAKEKQSLIIIDTRLKIIKRGSKEQAYQRRYDDIEVSKMHVFAVPEFWCEHIDEKLTRKKKHYTVSISKGNTPG